MLSDTLSDAVSDIEGYQRHKDDIYNYQWIKKELDKVTTVMDAMRLYLDTNWDNEYKPLAEAILVAIGELDVSPVAEKVIDLLTYSKNYKKGCRPLAEKAIKKVVAKNKKAKVNK